MILSLLVIGELDGREAHKVRLWPESRRVLFSTSTIQTVQSLRMDETRIAVRVVGLGDTVAVVAMSLEDFANAVDARYLGEP